MLRAMVLIIGLCSALAISANAAEGKKREQTEEQKALRKEMTEKYDKDKDGKLSADEKSAMSADDKAKWDKAFPPRKKKDA